MIQNVQINNPSLHFCFSSGCIPCGFMPQGDIVLDFWIHGFILLGNALKIIIGNSKQCSRSVGPHFVKQLTNHILCQMIQF